MATRVVLPYFAPDHLLPAPLPTVADILASKTKLSAAHEAPVVRVGEHFAVKFGQGVLLQEGENMLFVQQNSSVPVPKVYAIFHDEATKKNFIIHEYIEGEMLEKVWRSLSDADKTDVAAQLRQHCDELRRIPSPGYYGGIWRQPTQDFYFQDQEEVGRPHRDETISGPQETDEQWVEAMYRCVETRAKTDKRRFLSVLRGHYHKIFRGHKPVFTHADLFPGNIMLRVEDKKKKVVIIDWEHAGWYPDFWEYCCSMMTLRYRDDWGEWVPKVLDEYVAELGWMRYHRELVFIGAI
jgi:serine/threonine protein kinase